MTIKEFFEYIKDNKRDMGKALRKYVEATENFYTITGIKYTDMPKSKGKALGFDDLMANIEELFHEYLTLREQHKEIYEFYLSYINKLSNKTHRLIIEYSYINEDDDKQLAITLKEYHNLDYTNDYVRRLKSKAKKEFELLIDNEAIQKLEELKMLFNTKYHKLTQHNTKVC